MPEKIYLCPADRKYCCTWEGSAEDIFEHFSEEHEDLLHFTGSVPVNLDVASENHLLLFETEIYLLQSKISHDALNIFLRYLGPQKIASQLTFDIDVTANGLRLEKQNIATRNGCFSVPLECIQSFLGDVSTVLCKILVSGDFTSNDNTEETEDFDNSNITESDGNVLQRQESTESNNNHLNVPSFNFKKLSPSDKEALLSQVKLRDKKKYSLDETSRASWYGTGTELENQRSSNLSRSQTFSTDDLRRSKFLKRQSSMRSLDSIAETDLDAELRCSCCDGHLAPPIFLCLSSHNVCQNCYRNNDECDVCGKEITEDRNKELEDKAYVYLYSCTYKKNGCPRRLPFEEIADHEINCTFCQYACPMQACVFQAGFENMVRHLSLIHSSVKMIQSFIAVFQKYQELFLVNDTMGIFYCSWVLVDNKVIWKAKFCGPKARKYFCELKFKGKTFKKPLLLTKYDEYYVREMEVAVLKEQKLKAKHSILTITR